MSGSGIFSPPVQDHESPSADSAGPQSGVTAEFPLLVVLEEDPPAPHSSDCMESKMNSLIHSIIFYLFLNYESMGFIQDVSFCLFLARISQLVQIYEVIKIIHVEDVSLHKEFVKSLITSKNPTKTWNPTQTHPANNN